MRQSLLYLLPYITKYKWKFVLGSIAILLTNFFRVANPKIIQHAIDYLKSSFSLSQLGWFSILIVIISILEGCFSFLMRRLVIVASREIENDIRNNFFEKLTLLSPRFFHNMPTGDVMSRATNDLTAVRMMMGPGIAYSVNAIMAFLFVIPMMIFISPRLTLFTLIPFPLIAWIVNEFGKAIYVRFEKIQNQLAVLSTKAQENLSGSTIIKWYAQEDAQIEDFRVANKEYMKRNISHAKVQAAFRPSIVLTVGLSVVLILWIGGNLVIANTISIGEFSAFILYAGILSWPFVALGWVVGLFQQGTASLNRMRGVLDAMPDIQAKPNALKPEKLSGTIEFNHLTFAYKDGLDVLNNIHLQIPACSSLGIIGHTGSGKSTLTQLIPYLYKLPNNILKIDGVDINDYDPTTLRKFIGYVPQETFLFSTTIRENIAYGKPDATQETIEQAARIADVHDQIIDFPNGYDTILGEKGINLSGGQKQRVAIARAIIGEPNILIFDDAFSALDTATEAQILENLKSFSPDKTILLISHRVSTIQDLDNIIVIENGKISEQGNHAELIKQNGSYSWIYEKQLLEEALAKAE